MAAALGGFNGQQLTKQAACSGQLLVFVVSQAAAIHLEHIARLGTLEPSSPQEESSVTWETWRVWWAARQARNVHTVAA